MSSINKTMILGNLGKDPELRYTSDGNAVSNLTIATNKKWKDQQGNRQERTEWHRVVLYRALAETASKWLKQGSKVFIEGELQTRKWQDQQGIDRYTTEIIGSDLRMMGDGNTNKNASPTSNQHQANNQYQQPPQQHSSNNQHAPVMSEPQLVDQDDDCPF